MYKHLNINNMRKTITVNIVGQNNYILKIITSVWFLLLLYIIYIGINFLVICPVQYLYDKYSYFGILNIMFWDNNSFREIVILLTSIFSIIGLIVISLIPYILIVFTYLLVLMYLKYRKI